MFDNNFLFQNTALMAALTDFPNLRKKNPDALREILDAYDDVPTELIERHLPDVDSREELERYIHTLAVRSKDRPTWE